jgi:hypothetical protein
MSLQEMSNEMLVDVAMNSECRTDAYRDTLRTSLLDRMQPPAWRDEDQGMIVGYAIEVIETLWQFANGHPIPSTHIENVIAGLKCLPGLPPLVSAPTGDAG